MSWEEPKLFNLGVEHTEAGSGAPIVPDDQYTDNNGNDWYSYPS